MFIAQATTAPPGPADATAEREKEMGNVDVEYGNFITEILQVSTGGGAVGAVIALHFKPKVFQLKKLCDGTWEFHLIQIVREKVAASSGSAPQAREGNVGYLERMVPDGPHQGWGVDVDWQAACDDGYIAVARSRAKSLQVQMADLAAKIDKDGDGDGLLKGRLDILQWQAKIDELKLNKVGGKPKAGTVLTSLDPRYAQQRISTAVELFTQRTQQNNGNALVLQPPNYALLGGEQPIASLRDAPGVPINNDIVGMEFEVAALLEYGPPDNRTNMYLGSVSWGWERTALKSDVKLADLAMVSKSGVSEAFKAAAARWNTLRVADPAKLRGDSHPVIPLPPA